MLKIAHKDDYNDLQKRYQGARNSVAGASVRIMTSHFVVLLKVQKHPSFTAK